MSKRDKINVGDLVFYSNKNLSLPETEFQVIGESYWDDRCLVIEPTNSSARVPSGWSREVNASKVYLKDRASPLTIDSPRAFSASRKCLEVPKRSVNLKLATLPYDPNQQADCDDDI